MKEETKDLAWARIISVLIPVIVGSLLGTTASLATNYYTAKTQRRETIRKERAEHIERAMLLTSTFAQNVNQLIVATTAKPGAELSHQDKKDLQASSAALLELMAMIALYFPELKEDLGHIVTLHTDLGMRFDAITAANAGPQDLATYMNRIQAEAKPLMEAIGQLMVKIGQLAQHRDS